MDLRDNTGPKGHSPKIPPDARSVRTPPALRGAIRVRTTGKALWYLEQEEQDGERPTTKLHD